MVVCDPDTGQPVTKQQRQRELEDDLEAGRRRRLFRISKVDGRESAAERKHRLKRLVRAELAKLSPAGSSCAIGSSRR
jgi:hypothetical protein